ncbi:hypothetical protein NDU88_006140 [Pleurodeles waltl]|uniref:Uncharacterized protein n=1 Tax=Pleurodeles waltl TaxID=8319 RepID=A0AAV7VL29_PLEWA|nr:hypothetical protein NDU88_006140 [Pleurodeles waltl]
MTLRLGGTPGCQLAETQSHVPVYKLASLLVRQREAAQRAERPGAAPKRGGVDQKASSEAAPMLEPVDMQTQEFDFTSKTRRLISPTVTSV